MSLKTKVYKVCIPNTNRDFFYYEGSANITLGSQVLVSFRNRERLGFVIAKEHEKLDIALKPILKILDPDYLIPDEILKLASWISTYYHAPLSAVLVLALPKKLRLGKPLSLRKKNNNAPESSENLALEKPLVLNTEQKNALAEISADLNNYHAYLLHGVTGSGKTEIYLQTIQKILDQNRQCLVLVPEIGLTPQLLARFKARFAQDLTIIHSNLNENERLDAWLKAKQNQTKIVIGTRTALFTPLPNLGLIIIDEEHDHSYKQIEGVHYSARDAALVRASLAQIPIILGSATPSLESFYNIQKQKFKLLTLTQKALNQKPLHHQIIDLRKLALHNGLAQQTINCIGDHLQKNHQVLVFINRRGFSPVLLCHECAWIADCSACDSHLTLHRQFKALICHHCGRVQKIKLCCEQCQGKELIAVGSGTERIFECLEEHFPQFNILRIDRDTVRQKNSLAQNLNLIASGQAQLIVGTQMLAKGHHFPRLSLVVILDCDAGFYNQDFRAIERLGQLLVQVSGRAGRAENSGEVLIQTHIPHHPLLNLLLKSGYSAFCQELLSLREKSKLPPFTHLALIRAQHRQKNQVSDFLQQTKKMALQYGLNALGPAPAPLSFKDNQYHMRLLIKSECRKHLHDGLKQLRQSLSGNKLTWHLDVDPIDLS